MTLIVSAVVTVGCIVAFGGLAGAQQSSPGAGQSQEFGVRAPAQRPVPELGLEPTQPTEEKGAREQEFYPGVLIRSRHEPAFVQPFVASVPVSRTSRARIGLSGWTAPALPYDFPDATGGVAFGLTIVWGAPAPEAKAPQPEGAGQR